MKKIQILIITLVALLLLACATFVGLYFATDMFKSDKNNFLKYVSQINLKDFADFQAYNNYQKRMISETYSNDGIIEIGYKYDDIDINESIDYSGYTDPRNKRASSKININRNDEKLLTFDYLKNENLYGIKFEDIVSQYIVVENKDLKEFAKKLGIQDTAYIPNKIEDINISDKLNQDELKQIYSRYLKLIIEQIPEENYSKTDKQNIELDGKNMEVDGYKLTLKAKDIQSITIKILDTMKNDEQVFNLVNDLSGQNITVEDYQNVLSEIIAQISNEMSNEENIELVNIIVYKKGKETVKVSAKIGEITEASIEKINNIMLVTLNIQSEDQKDNIQITKTQNSKEQEKWECVYIEELYDEEIIKINFNIERIGEITSQEVSYKFSLNTSSEGVEFNIKNSNNIKFDNKLNIEEFNDSNHAVINNMNQEQLNNLLTNLINKISEKVDISNGILRTIMSFGVSDLEKAANKAMEETKNAELEEQRLLEELQQKANSGENF